MTTKLTTSLSISENKGYTPQRGDFYSYEKKAVYHVVYVGDAGYVLACLNDGGYWILPSPDINRIFGNSYGSFTKLDKVLVTGTGYDS